MTLNFLLANTMKFLAAVFVLMTLTAFSIADRCPDTVHECLSKNTCYPNRFFVTSGFATDRIRYVK